MIFWQIINLAMIWASETHKKSADNISQNINEKSLPRIDSFLQMQISIYRNCKVIIAVHTIVLKPHDACSSADTLLL